MPLLTREVIAGLPVPKLKVTKVPLPEMGEGMEAYVGEMTSDERDERLETLWLNRKEKLDRESNVGFRAFAAAAALCDADRNWVAPSEKDINELADRFAEMNAVPITRLFNHVCNLCGLTPEDVAELEKNLPTTTSDAGSGG